MKQVPWQRCEDGGLRRWGRPASLQSHHRPCKLQARQKNLSPLDPNSQRSASSSHLHRSTLSPILPPILHALLIADAVYCTFMPVPCRPLTQVVTCPTFTFLVLRSESPSDQSIGQLAWPPPGPRSTTAFHGFAVTYNNDLSTTACSLWNSAGFIAVGDCSPSL